MLASTRIGIIGICDLLVYYLYKIILQYYNTLEYDIIVLVYTYICYNIIGIWDFVGWRSTVEQSTVELSNNHDIYIYIYREREIDR